jgi:prepilin-type N-terminal cleavage/methylation domain-containing protein
MKRGFSLIELVVALLISSLLTLSLFQLLQQTRKAVRRITNVIAIDEPFIALYNQLEKDITGMFAPNSSVEAYREKDKKEKAEKDEKKAEKKEEKSQEKPEPKKELKPIKDVFVLDAKKEQIFWSFITTGGLQVLDSEGTIVPQPALKRVVYMLEKDPQRPDVYRFMYRFSALNLDLNAFKGADFTPSYELISGIKRLEIELTLFEIPEKTEAAPPGKKEQPAPEKKQPLKPATVKEWQEEEIWKKYKTLIPAYVKIKGDIADATGVEYPFEFMFKVYAYRPYKQKEQTLFEAIEEIAKSIFKSKGSP